MGSESPPTVSSVVIRRNEAVRAAATSREQAHRLPLSNLDLFMVPVDFSVFFCYRKPSDPSVAVAGMTRVLKNSLAQALGTFYVLAGELDANPATGEPEILCNNRGVDFIEAYADVSLSELRLYDPHACLDGKLLPKKERGVMCVQALELSCGSLIVACTFNHQIADAYSANMFLVSWAEAAQMKPISAHPIFLPSLVKGSSLPLHATHNDKDLKKDTFLPASISPEHAADGNAATDMLCRFYYITGESISFLQSQAGCGRRTKLETFASYLWRAVARSEKKPGKTCKMAVAVDGRNRLGSGDDGLSSVMANYFGNVISVALSEESVEDLLSRPLSWAADGVHDSIISTARKEHFLELISMVEELRTDPMVSWIARSLCRNSSGGPELVLSSGMRFPVEKVNFGWGKPVFWSYHLHWECGPWGYVMPMPSASKEGDWVVFAHLQRRQMESLEENEGKIFRPLTPEYYLGFDKK